MALTAPPQRSGSLSTLPEWSFSGTGLYRIWRYVLPDGTRQRTPWWFASAEITAGEGGRFDLPPPMGTCYLATRPEAAVLEALQMHLTNLPRSELSVRRLAALTAPGDAPAAAMLTARRVAGQFGITAELWADRDRALTRSWAVALRRDGWWAIYSGVRHDPSGRLRSVALFDAAGAHPPTHGGRWKLRSRPIDRDRSLEKALVRYGVTVRDPGQLPWAEPPD